MKTKSDTVSVKLNTIESGTLCHLLMKAMNDSGGIYKQPEWVIVLYNKLVDANDKLMGKS